MTALRLHYTRFPKKKPYSNIRPNEFFNPKWSNKNGKRNTETDGPVVGGVKICFLPILIYLHEVRFFEKCPLDKHSRFIAVS